MLEARRLQKLEERRAAIHKVLRLVNEHALYVPLLLQPEVDAMTARVKGFKPNLLGKPRFDDTWLEG